MNVSETGRAARTFRFVLLAVMVISELMVAFGAEPISRYFHGYFSTTQENLQDLNKEFLLIKEQSKKLNTYLNERRPLPEIPRCDLDKGQVGQIVKILSKAADNHEQRIRDLRDGNGALEERIATIARVFGALAMGAIGATMLACFPSVRMNGFLEVGYAVIVGALAALFIYLASASGLLDLNQIQIYSKNNVSLDVSAKFDVIQAKMFSICIIAGILSRQIIYVIVNRGNQLANIAQKKRLKS